jgi:3-hydroxybutyryl-CoA dehydrogenase
MGRGIAQVAAAAGIEVALCDASLELAEKGKALINAIVGKQAEKGKISSEDHKALVDRITPAGGMAAFSGVDLAVEAVTENVELKLDLFRKADAALAPPSHPARSSRLTHLPFRSRASPPSPRGPSA